MEFRFVQKAISANVGTWGIHFITASIFCVCIQQSDRNYYYAESNILFIKNNRFYCSCFRCTCLWQYS
ncbi:alanine:cation symporter family protein [Mediterraneibacter gnavus]